MNSTISRRVMLTGILAAPLLASVRPSHAQHRSRATIARMKTSARIRLIVVAAFVTPDFEDGSVRFTIGDAHDAARQVLGWGIQQQHVRGALTARGPLEFLGITWVNQEGAATQYQEIHWTWNQDHDILRHVVGVDDAD